MSFALTSPVSYPLIFTVLGWAAGLFCGFGLMSRANAMSIPALTFGSIAVASAAYLILDLSSPYAGFFRASPGPLEQVLGYIREIRERLADSVSRRARCLRWRSAGTDRPGDRPSVSAFHPSREDKRAGADRSLRLRRRLEFKRAPLIWPGHRQVEVQREPLTGPSSPLQDHVAVAFARTAERRQPVERLAIPAATGKWLRRSVEGTACFGSGLVSLCQLTRKIHQRSDSYHAPRKILR